MANVFARISSLVTAAGVLCLLDACTTIPIGPSVMVLPGSGKNFDQFRADDYECRQFAFGQVGGPAASSASVDSGVSSAAVGTVLGAVAGAAINGSHGAGVGAGTGLLFGGLAGTGAANASAYGVQRRYDLSYVQCMYAKGDRVPVAGEFATASRRAPLLSSPSPGSPPPPPGNNPPPSPPPDLPYQR